MVYKSVILANWPKSTIQTREYEFVDTLGGSGYLLEEDVINSNYDNK